MIFFLRTGFKSRFNNLGKNTANYKRMNLLKAKKSEELLTQFFQNMILLIKKMLIE